MINVWMALLIALLAGLSVATLFVGILGRRGTTTTRRRVERLWLPAPAKSAGEPFVTRVLRPMIEVILRSLSRLLPRTLVTSVETRLRTAGVEASAPRFVGWWLGAGLLPPLVLLAFVVASGSPGTLVLLMFAAWIAAGAFLPLRWLRGRAERRTRAINRGLPDAIDMIVTSVEAGLGIQQAMITVAEKFKGAVGEEFGQVVAETKAGRTRADAMTDMAVRSGSRDLTLFVRAVNQAEEMGLAIGGVLRNQASEVRERRQQYAREQAAKIPVKMTIPTILLMLPTLFILLLTPVILNAVESFGGG